MSRKEKIKWTFLTIIGLIQAGVLMYFIGWPLMKMIYLIIAFPFEALTNIQITPGAKIFEINVSDTNPFSFIIGIWYAFFILAFVILFISATVYALIIEPLFKKKL